MEPYRGDVRDSDIQALAERVQRGGYEKYLRRLTLAKVRQFDDREVSFDFPVTALVGPNGGGKTTILGAAGLIYKEVKPRRFFAKSGKYDASMQNWAIEYDLIDRSLQRASVQRTASFRRARWNRDSLDRTVEVFGVMRTVPATERNELAKALGPRFSAKSEDELLPEIAAKAQWVLGKQLAGFSRLSLDDRGRVTLLSAKTPGGDYSEFHFGAGEASVIRMISKIESAPDNSLILIEEIENGLHPVATRRMVEYLLDAAKRKSVQVIFTTHSDEALAPLPGEAIWASFKGEVMQGRLDIQSLRTLTGETSALLAIYVEDRFAETMVATALRAARIPLDGIKIHGMGGEANATHANKHRNLDPAGNFKSVCVLDGDQTPDPPNRVFTLPGGMSPEAYVFEFVRSQLDQNAARLAIALGLPVSDQTLVREVVERRAVTNQDRHIVFSQIGEDLGYLAEMYVQQAFLNEWANFSGDPARLVDALSAALTEAGIKVLGGAESNGNESWPAGVDRDT